MARGLSNAEIGRELWLSQQTVKFHLTNIYRKLGVANRTEAARVAMERGPRQPVRAAASRAARTGCPGVRASQARRKKRSSSGSAGGSRWSISSVCPIAWAVQPASVSVEASSVRAAGSSMRMRMP